MTPPPTEKRVCLLTGASGRLGLTFCRLFAHRYQIAAVYFKHEPPLPSQSQRLIDPLQPRAPLTENGHPLYSVCADLSRDSEHERLVDAVLTQFGRIDLLVNAAARSTWAPLDDPRLWSSAPDQFSMNVLAPFKLVVTVARRFWHARAHENAASNRNVVNVSSTAASNIYSHTGQSIYAASKAALNHLTRHMASELSSVGVRVNATAPNSFPRIVSTERVAQSIVELDDSRVTGQVLVLDRAPGRSGISR